MMTRNNNKGFSLIELMIVVAVIAILAAVAIPSYLGIQKKAARSEAKSKLEAIALAMEGYMAENNDYGDVAGVYTYVCGPGCNNASFVGGPAGIGTMANLGNNLMYSFQLTVTTAAPPAFGISAIPMPGSRVEGDITIWLRSDGVKGPNGAGW